MEPQQEVAQAQNPQNEFKTTPPPGGGSNNNNSSNYSMCRQSSTRWTPTTDQIRILKELYYNNGVRSPTADQIQRISSRLRQFGKIEGKNVFYWFQNHKARERQKKRFISDHQFLNHNTSSNFLLSPASTATTLHRSSVPHQYGAVNVNVNASSSASPGGVFAVGPVGTFAGYGTHHSNASIHMENSFRDCSLSAAGGGNGNHLSQNTFGWVGVDPYATPYATTNFHNEKRNHNNYVMETLEEEEQEDEDQNEINYDEEHNHVLHHEIETLPLFPMHNNDHDHHHNMISNGHFCNIKSPAEHGYYSSGSWYGGGRSRTSLELTLSYSGRSHDSA